MARDREDRLINRGSELSRLYVAIFQTPVIGQKRMLRPSKYQSVELNVPSSFLLVLLFLFCAVISPLVAAGVVWSLNTKRWRQLGERAGKMGVVLATMSIATYFSLNALLEEGTAVKPISVAIAGGAGFTAGVVGICAWLWVRNRESLATAD